MGRALRHTPMCIDCGGIFPHNLTVCIRKANGKKVHRCLACDELKRQRQMEEWKERAQREQ